MIRAVTSSRSIRLLLPKKRVQEEASSWFARSKERPEIVRCNSVQGEGHLAFFAFIPKSLSWLRFSGTLAITRDHRLLTDKPWATPHRVPAGRLTARKIGAFCVLNLYESDRLWRWRGP
jgi:hypothetical protein